MTAPVSSDLTALLDDLERAHAAATPGPWQVREDHGRDISDEGWSFIRVVQPNGDEVATTWPIGHERHEPEADAALIVAAVNAVPQLVAAVRGVLALAGELEANFEHGDSVHRLARNMCSRRLRSTLTAALSPESVQS